MDWGGVLTRAAGIEGTRALQRLVISLSTAVGGVCCYFNGENTPDNSDQPEVIDLSRAVSIRHDQNVSK